MEQQASVDDLKRISEQLGSFLILMFVASVGINIEFSYQQLSILAVACLLLVLPHYKEITIQGLKLVRLHQNEPVATKQNPRE